MATAPVDGANAGAIASAVLACWQALPKNGKPQPNEHTVLAGFAITAPWAPQPQVVALGTGTKCLPASRRSLTGDLVNDGHAEAVARRALLAWLHDQLALALQAWEPSGTSSSSISAAGTGGEPRPEPPSSMAGQSQPRERVGAAAAAAAARPRLPFAWCPGLRRFRLAPGVQLHMYVSQPPCGDASICEAAAEEGVPAGGSGRAGEGAGAPAAQALQAAPQPATAEGAGGDRSAGSRTGAKLIRMGGEADVGAAAARARPLDAGPESTRGGSPAPSAAPLAAAGAAAGAPAVPQAGEVEQGPQALGAPRRKPGRGEATLSMSCSDKLARWALLGVQGCLLAGLLEAPLYLSTLVVAVGQGAEAGSGGGGGGGSEGGAAAAAAHAAGARAAIARGVGGRTREVAVARLAPPFAWRPPVVATVPLPPAQLGLAPSDARTAPSGAAVNFTAARPTVAGNHATCPPRPAPTAGTHEVTLSATGRRFGTGKKALAAGGGAGAASRLSPRALLASFCALHEQAMRAGATAGGRGTEAATVAGPGAGGAGAASLRGLAYAQVKQLVGAGYMAAWAELRRPPSLFAGWLPKPPAGALFSASGDGGGRTSACS